TTGDLDKAIIRRNIRRNIQKITYCYEKQLVAKPGLAGTVTVQFTIAPAGTVSASAGAGVDTDVAHCVADVIKAIEFPKPPGGAAIQVTYPFTFRSEAAPEPAPAREPAPAPEPEEDRGGPPLTGKLADVMNALHDGHPDRALAIATPWHAAEPGDVLALIALGEAREAKHELPRAS